jgi:hypothetical protein
VTRSGESVRHARRFTVLLLVAVGCASAPRNLGPDIAPNATASLAALHEGWNTIADLPGTTCADGSSFHLVVHRGAPDKLLLFFNGGGACWRAQDCDPRGHVTYTVRADTANTPGMSGIFDYTNAANPLRDFTMVWVPYCTGDVHLGMRDVEYRTDATASGGARTFVIRHEGGSNADAALSWAFGAVAHPSVVVVAGGSAGAIPSPVFAVKVAQHYPDARVVQLGDGAGGYGTKQVSALLEGWGAVDYLRRDPTYRDYKPPQFNFEMLYITSAREAPRVTFAQYNTVDDAVQLYFLSLLGVKGLPLRTFLAADLKEIHHTNHAFRSYTAPGAVHTVLRSNAVYTTTVDGVSFRDWLAGLVEGRPVNDVGTALLDPR